ncbi:DUF2971 domain-containing protein [Shewanella sp.]|uniref:DUF2971 domain-containing protein n=1 Tax=Shewanella sp. TaxID=50422 RepID=UPI001B6D1ED8|nr:DUF2971 domain-containing protein [Shewanella sp.]MBP6517559.1 DUF2971 domain-containing protein [Shewanella sp.]
MNDIIYHYTSVDSFLKIITGRTIWVSSVTEMNDSFESTWYEQYAKSPESKKVVDTINDRRLNKQFHVCCFSKYSDLLSQWRGYGDSGAGVAIGFNKRKLEDRCAGLNSGTIHAEIFDVIYNKREQNRFFKNVCNSIEKQINFNNLRALPFILKSPSFLEEGEVRLFMQVSARTYTESGLKIKYRVVNGNIITYTEFPFDMTDIEDIIVGPKSSLNIESADFKQLCSTYQNFRAS